MQFRYTFERTDREDAFDKRTNERAFADLAAELETELKESPLLTGVSREKVLAISNAVKEVEKAFFGLWEDRLPATFDAFAGTVRALKEEGEPLPDDAAGQLARWNQEAQTAVEAVGELCGRCEPLNRLSTETGRCFQAVFLNLERDKVVMTKKDFGRLLATLWSEVFRLRIFHKWTAARRLCYEPG